MTLVLAHYRYLQSILTGPSPSVCGIDRPVLGEPLGFWRCQRGWARGRRLPNDSASVLDTTTDLRRSAAVRVTLHGHDINIINWTMLLAISSHLRHLDIFMHPLSIIIHYLVVREFLRIHLLSHSHPGPLAVVFSSTHQAGPMRLKCRLEMRKIGQSWGISQGVIVQGPRYGRCLSNDCLQVYPTTIESSGAYPFVRCFIDLTTL